MVLLLWHNECVILRLFPPRGVCNVREAQRRKRPSAADRREPEEGPDLSVSVHRYSRKAADHLFLRFERAAGKEQEIQKHLNDGIDYAAGQVTVIELLERYIGLKQGVRYNTEVRYNFVLNLVKKEDFGYRQIGSIKVSDVQQWIIKLHQDGKGYSTITSVCGAFQMACNEDIIRRNPFDFKLLDVVPNDSQKRIAMAEEQQNIWMSYIQGDRTYAKYYDAFVVLLGTGMHVSEFCGLTMSDLDFSNRRIRVDHQLVRERGGKYYVEKTKTACGVRFIPMTDDVHQSLKNILASRKKWRWKRLWTGTAVLSCWTKTASRK